MNQDFTLGYKAGELHYNPEFTLDGKSLEFIRGFSQWMREQEFLSGNPDTDSLDY